MTKRLIVAVLLMATSTTAVAADIVVHRDPGCGCCEKWARQLRTQLHRNVRVVDNAARSGFDDRLGVPANLRSCHTAIVDGLVFEGHVPIADIARLIAARPKGVTGLAVGGMPTGSPGMEVPGVRPEPFDVIAFGTAGRSVFARH